MSTKQPSALKVPDYILREQEADPDGKLWKRYAEAIEGTVVEEVPPLPRQILVEVANICNHSCSFCAYQKMTRPSQYIKVDLFQSVMRQAYALGAREVGLHGGSEPMSCKALDQHIRFCAEVGYKYIYFTTNGTLATRERWKACIDAGLHSVKFSINGGDRETYKRIHGKDEFEKALANLRWVSEYRKTLGRPLYLAVSFVEVPENAASFAALREIVGPLVDEVFHVVASNQSGQMPGLDVAPSLPSMCQIPFNQVNITREGFLRGCCNDYQNMLVLEDLNKVSLAEAWAGEHARALRRRHLTDDLEGTLCHNCVRGCTAPIKPLRPDLADWEQLV